MFYEHVSIQHRKYIFYICYSMIRECAVIELTHWQKFLFIVKNHKRHKRQTQRQQMEILSRNVRCVCACVLEVNELWDCPVVPADQLLVDIIWCCHFACPQITPIKSTVHFYFFINHNAYVLALGAKTPELPCLAFYHLIQLMSLLSLIW